MSSMTAGRPARPTQMKSAPAVVSWATRVWSDLAALVAYAAVIMVFFQRMLVAGMAPLGHDLLFHFFPGQDALRYGAVLCVFLAAFFTYLFGRLSLQLSSPASWVAGAVFAFGGYLGAHAGNLSQLQAAVWLPVLLLCLERSTVGRSRVAVVVGGVAAASQLVGGQSQRAYYSGWALVLFALYLALFGGFHRWRRLLPFAALLSMGIAGAAMAAGVQLLSPLELIRGSSGLGGSAPGDATAVSVQLTAILDTVLPLYFATPDPAGVTAYTGIASLVLLPAALARRERPGYQWLLSGLAAVALVLALGNETPVYRWLYGVVPGFDLLGAPSGWLSLYSFSLALLTGMAVDQLRMPAEKDALQRWVGAYGAVLSVGVALLVGLRLWLGTQDHELALPHPRIVLNWWLFAGAGMAASLGTRSWPGSRLALGLLIGLLLLELYLAREPLQYNRPALAAPRAQPALAWPSTVMALRRASDRYTPADEANRSVQLTWTAARHGS